MPLYALVLLIAILVIGFLIWLWMKNKVGTPFLPENFELKPIKSIRDGDKLTTTFRLVPTITGANPKKFKVTLTPDVPEGKLNPGAVIGNAVITKGTDNKDLYTVTFIIERENAIDSGENYAINVNDGANLRQTDVPEGLPVEISSAVGIKRGSTDKFFLLKVNLQYNYGESPIEHYSVKWINNPSPHGQLRITKNGQTDNSWPMTIKIFIPKTTIPITYDIEEYHKYDSIDTLKPPPPTTVDDPR